VLESKLEIMLTQGSSKNPCSALSAIWPLAADLGQAAQHAVKDASFRLVPITAKNCLNPTQEPCNSALAIAGAERRIFSSRAKALTVTIDQNKKPLNDIIVIWDGPLAVAQVVPGTVLIGPSAKPR
jgi:hypothetical protein